MCEPATIAMTALSIAGTAYGAVQQNKAANRQAKAIGMQQQAEANAQQLQMNQVSNQAAQEMNERNRQAMAEAATFDAITGEYGGGATASRQAAELAFNRNNDLSSIQTNRNSALSQIGMESQGAALRSKAQLASIQRPTYLGTALTIAGQAGSAYAPFYAQEVAEAKRLGRGAAWRRVSGSEPLGLANENRPNRAGA